MRPLIIDNTLKEGINYLKQYAYAHLLTMDKIRQLIAEKRSVGDEPGRKLVTPFGYTIVLSLEEHPSGWFAHASFSVPAKEKYPNPVAINALLALLGFHYNLDDKGKLYIYEEKEFNALNIMEQIKSPV